MALTATIVRQFSELESLSAEWTRLLERSPQAEIFHALPWMRAWWAGYRTDYAVHTPVVRDESGVVAIWPLVRHGTRLRAMGHGMSDQNDLLVAPGVAVPALHAALNALAAEGGGWDTGQISNVSERSQLYGALNTASIGSRVRIETVRSGTGFTWASQGDAASFITLARKESLRRHRKKLERLGAVSFRHIDDPEEIRSHFVRFQRQHIERWTLRGVESPFLNGSARTFYDAMLEHLCSEGALRFGVLEVDGVPVAYHLGFERYGKFVWYKPTFDVDLAECGPGEVLLQCVLQHCAASGVKELDFTIGDETYKRRFSNLDYAYFNVHLFRRPCIAQYALRTRERLKQHRQLYSLLKDGAYGGAAVAARVRDGVRRNGVAGLAKKALRRITRRWLFQRDAVTVFRLDKLPATTDGTPEIEVVPFCASLLASALLSNPLAIDRNRMARLLKRSGSGDRGYMGLVDGRVAHVAWVGERTSIVATSETGPDCALPLPQPVSVIYDCWTVKEYRGRGVYPAVLRRLAAEEMGANREVWIYCLAENRASRSGILKAGFAEAARMTRVRWLGRWEHTGVSSLGQAPDA